jgi:acyl transferase domain-containing protein
MGSIGPQESLSGYKEPLAIIGMATKLPGDATSVDKTWEMLLRGRCAAGPFPKDRLNADAYYHPDPDHGGTVCCYPDIN